MTRRYFHGYIGNFVARRPAFIRSPSVLSVVSSVYSGFRRCVRGFVGVFVACRYIRFLSVYPWSRRYIRGYVGIFVFRRYMRGSTGVSDFRRYIRDSVGMSVFSRCIRLFRRYIRDPSVYPCVCVRGPSVLSIYTRSMRGRAAPYWQRKSCLYIIQSECVVLVVRLACWCRDRLVI